MTQKVTYKVHVGGGRQILIEGEEDLNSLEPETVNDLDVFVSQLRTKHGTEADITIKLWRENE